MPIYKVFDKTFFKKWSRDVAYILGFLFADGNIVKTKRNTHFMAIYSADFDLMFSMREAIGSNHKIGIRNIETGGVYVIQIGSKELFHDLGRFGLSPNKAKRMRIPEIPEKYVSDFIRGYFDGDGCVWYGLVHKNRTKLATVLRVCFTSASFEFLSGLLSLLKCRGIIGGSLFRSKKGNYSRLQFGMLNSLKIYEIMYNAPHRLFLGRKKLVFEKCMKMRS